MTTVAHLEALRPSLARHFKHVTSGVSDAGKIKQLYDELMGASHALLYELVCDWGASNSPIMRLPPEVLALCFTLLPLRDRVSASHVSRRWRTISISNPAIWAHIDSESCIRNKVELFAMALNRTGNYPVDLLDCPDEHDVVEDLLVDHMHHIRSLYYPRKPKLAPLSHLAPSLETFVCDTSFTVHLTTDFLGGAVGRLRKLHINVVTLPATCPTLSTVTELSLQGPYNVHYAKHFHLLFHLFPALQSLTFVGLRERFAQFLPAGPAPSSLRHLNLDSGYAGYDLTLLYADWCPRGELAHLDINHLTPLSDSLVDFFDSATALDVLHDADRDLSVITSTGPGARYRRLRYWDEEADQSVLAARLMDLSSVLQNVCALSIPALSLAPFLAIVALLPELSRLTLTMVGSHEWGHEPHEYCWDALAPLTRLAHGGKLQSIVLHVSACAHPQCAPSTQNAADLIAQLSALESVMLPDVTVTGLPVAALRDVAPAVFSGFRVVFEPAV